MSLIINGRGLAIRGRGLILGNHGVNIDGMMALVTPTTNLALITPDGRMLVVMQEA